MNRTQKRIDMLRDETVAQFQNVIEQLETTTILSDASSKLQKDSTELEEFVRMINQYENKVS